MTPVTIDTSFLTDPGTWLLAWYKNAQNPEMPYLLAHTDDGVVWGIIEKGVLNLSSQQQWQAVSRQAQLTGMKIQQLRLFGPAGELFFWRVEEGVFNGRYLTDAPTPPTDSYEEYHLLWGEGVETGGKFTLLRDGEQELYHAPPLPQARGRRVRLKVRHYIEYDARQQAYVGLSRLVDLEQVNP